MLEHTAVTPAYPENDGLSLEYKLQERCAIGDLQVSDIVNNPIALGVLWISGSGLEEQLLDFLRRDARPLGDDRTNPALISLD